MRNNNKFTIITHALVLIVGLLAGLFFGNTKVTDVAEVKSILTTQQIRIGSTKDAEGKDVFMYEITNIDDITNKLLGL